MQLNLIGTGQGWKLAPCNGVAWGVNNVIFKRRVDLLFDMHDHFRIEGSRKAKCDRVANECKRLGVEAYSIHENPEYNYRRYPIELISQRFKTSYFSNGVCYMIALALDIGFKRLDLYGINHNKDLNPHEYVEEKAGVDFWLGIATGMGVEWEAHGEFSMIGKIKKPYGYEIWNLT